IRGFVRRASLWGSAGSRILPRNGCRRRAEQDLGLPGKLRLHVGEDAIEVKCDAKRHETDRLSGSVCWQPLVKVQLHAAGAPTTRSPGSGKAKPATEPDHVSNIWPQAQ